MAGAAEIRSTILIVDDDPSLLQALPDAVRLRLPDVTVEALASGKDAITTLANGHYDVLIIDIMMPDVKGTEVVAQIRRTVPWLPVIFITGNLTPPADVSVLRPFAVLHKPIDRAFLADTLRRALRYGRVARRLLRQSKRVQEHTQKAIDLHAKVTHYLSQHPGPTTGVDREV